MQNLNSANGTTEVLGSTPSLTCNRLEAKVFIKALAGVEDAKVTFALFSDNNESLKPKTLYGSLDEYCGELVADNAQGYGVFITVQETSSRQRKADDIGKTRAFFIDLDVVGEQPEYHLEPSLVVSTSPGRYHSYWLLETPEKLTKEEFKSYQSKLVQHYGSDEKCVDLPRVMRLPGFFHHKKQPYFCSILKNSGKKYKKEDIINLPVQAPQLPLFTPDLENFKPHVVPTINDHYKEVLREKCKSTLAEIGKLAEGKRNNTINKKCFQLGGYLAHTPDIREWFIGEFELSLDIWIKTKGWGSREKTLDTAVNALEAGSKKPISLNDNKTDTSIEKLSAHRRIKSYILAWLESAGSLEWNEMGLSLELNREPVEAETMRQIFLDDMNVDCGKEMFKDIAVHIGKQNSYHPVREYIENLPENSDESALATLYEAMGVADPFHQILIRKFLIASIARALNPGIKHDNVLVLKGKQGTGKTTFFEALFGKEFFQTLGKHRTEADEIMALTSTWCSEYGELETALGYKSVSEMKNFLTRNYDIFRPPYGEKQIKVLRSFSLVGTTNQDTFLSDSTGNRRFWVVVINQIINNAKVAEIRDAVWSVAKALYLAGEKHYFDSKKDEDLAELNVANFEMEDMLAPQILSLMKSREWVSIAWLADQVQLPKDRRTDMRLGEILRKARCQRERRTIDGQKCNCWRYDGHWDEHYSAIERKKQQNTEKLIEKKWLIQQLLKSVAEGENENEIIDVAVIYSTEDSAEILSEKPTLIADICARFTNSHKAKLIEQGINKIILRDSNTEDNLETKTINFKGLTKKDVDEAIAYIESLPKA